MSHYLEEARKLGEMLLASEESKRLADARAAFNADDDAQDKMAMFQSLQHRIMEKLRKENPTEEEKRNLTRQLHEMAAQLQKEPVVGDLLQADQDFNALVTQVMNIIRMTAGGQEAEGGCGSGCSGNCGGCH